MPEAVFERRMSRHLELLAQELEQLANRPPRVNFNHAREARMYRLASDMRALSQIMLSDSIAKDEETKAQG